MMLHSELEVTGRSVDSFQNMIRNASQADTAHIREPRSDSSARRRGSEMKTAPWLSREDQP